MREALQNPFTVLFVAFGIAAGAVIAGGLAIHFITTVANWILDSEG